MAMIVLVSIPVYLVVSLNRYVSIETLYKDKYYYMGEADLIRDYSAAVFL